MQFEEQLRAGAMAPADLPRLARRAGVSGVEFREVYWKDRPHEIPPTRRAIDDHGVIATYATFSTLLDADPNARARLLEQIDDARDLGVSIMRVFRGAWPFGGDEKSMWAGARTAIERAADYGITLMLENYLRVPGNHRFELEAALHVLRAPNLRVNVDIANYVQNGEDPLANIRAFGSRIGYSHLKDVRRTETRLAVVPVGDGDLDWSEILDHYDATGNPFPLTLEHQGGDDPLASIVRAREALERSGLPTLPG
ncbi:MAG: sugar phosphate isomerase/epimerase [Chloroflexi bacterium]|nr:sugar phosphate isomerase/epimerase [Chloroflexota bacterium]